MKSVSITKAKNKSAAKTVRASSKFDWRAFDAMTDEEVEAAALSDPDAQPLTPERMKRMKRTPQVKVIRRALRLSQEEFAQAFRIPIGTLRDWEQGRVEPDQAARAYLTIIAMIPKAVREALEKSPRPLV
jgi:putative transcriptional regulator